MRSGHFDRVNTIIVVEPQEVFDTSLKKCHHLILVFISEYAEEGFS